MRRWSLLLPVLLVALLGTPALAGDTGPDDVVRALRSDPVYVDPDVDEDVIDRTEVRAQIARSNSLPVYVAVLPEAAVDAVGSERQLNGAIGSRLGSSVVLFTVTGDTITGGAGGGTGLGAGQADAIAKGAGGGDLTSRLVRVVAQTQSAVAQSGGRGGSSGGSPDGGFSSEGSGGGGGAVLGVLALLGVGGGALYYTSARRRRRRDEEGSRADVTSLYDRLGADVSNLHAGDDPVARQALADAAERYNATGALLSQADTPGEYEAARRTVVEGLAATRLARERLGLDPGPEIPPPPSTGPQLQQAQRVVVGDEEYEGSPTYAPGRGHYFGGGTLGGRYVPGGWYGVPFWETMLMTSVLTGAFGGGGLFGGGYGGYGSGYGAGYEEAVEDMRGGGDWGGGGGFDLGGSFGGGGDWGGGGGGDWGGGGGGSW